MSISIFFDKQHPPTAQEINGALGSRQPLWEKLTQFIADSYRMSGALTYGGRNYGWNLWFRHAGKPLVSLYPRKDGFVAQVVLGNKEVEQADHLKLGKNVRSVFDETPQLYDGRWLFIKVKTEKDVKDIEQLLQIKKRPTLPIKV